MTLTRRLALHHAAAFLLAGASRGVHAASTAREQCEALTRAALAMTRELLRQHGEFPPYGLGLTAGDEVMEIDESVPPDGVRAADAGDALRATLAEVLKAHAVEATALVYEATLTAPPPGSRGDAIAIQLAHRDGYRAVIVYPYRFQGSDVVLGAAQVIEQKGPLPRAKAKRKAVR
jgi:hypothetical protein